MEKNNLRIEWGSRIRQLRIEQSISARTLAEMVGTHAMNIHRIEEGKYSIRFEMLVNILDALGYKLEITPK